MDFDIIVYILLIIGSILLPFVKKFIKEEADRTVKKNRGTTVTAEPVVEEEVARPVRKATKAKAAPTPDDKEYFTYESMSERDFEQEFAHNVEEHPLINANSVPSDSKIQLSMEEEDVFKGVIWSEILKRKY